MKSISTRYVLTVVLLIATVVGSGLSDRRISDHLGLPLESIPRQIAQWTETQDEDLSVDVLKILNPTSYLARTYQSQGHHLGLFIAYYAQQRGGESMHSPKACLPANGWEIWQHGSSLIPVAGKSIQVNKYSVEKSGQRMLVFYWYQTKDRIIANEYLGKILLVRDALFTGHTSGSIVRITLPDATDSTDEGIAFASNVIPEVQRCLRN